MPWQCEADGIFLALVVGRGWSRRLTFAGTVPPLSPALFCLDKADFSRSEKIKDKPTLPGDASWKVHSIYLGAQKGSLPTVPQTGLQETLFSVEGTCLVADLGFCCCFLAQVLVWV